jgi:hypothetical protein
MAETPDFGVNKVAAPRQGRCFRIDAPVGGATLDLRAIPNGAGTTFSVVGRWVTLRAYGNDLGYYLRPVGSTMAPSLAATTAVTPEQQCDRVPAGGLSQPFFVSEDAPILAMIAAAGVCEVRGHDSQSP